MYVIVDMFSGNSDYTLYFLVKSSLPYEHFIINAKSNFASDDYYTGYLNIVFFIAKLIY